jgi:hypothetical protein
MNAQLAQERYRSNHNSYGTLAETGVRASSASGYYAVQVTSNSRDGFEVLASATARQARDNVVPASALVSLGRRGDLRLRARMRRRRTPPRSTASAGTSDAPRKRAQRAFGGCR